MDTYRAWLFRGFAYLLEPVPVFATKFNLIGERGLQR